MDLPDRTQAKSWEGRDVVDRSGQALGRCVGVFADTATGVAEWLDVDVSEHGRRFIPAIEAADTDGSVRVRFSRDEVVGAPTLGDDDQLSKAEEIELYRHYGVAVEAGESASVLPADVGGTPSTGATSAVVGGAAVAGVAGTSAEVGTSDYTRANADTGTTGDDDTRLDTATEGLGPADAVPSGHVETGEDLPVLDPAAASTPVPEGQVTYVDEREDFTDEPAATAGPTETEPSPALPPPTLRRVSQSTAPAPSAAPAPGSTGPDLAAAAPLGAIAAGMAAVALVLRAREARQRRRNAPAARADRLRRTLQSGSSAALSSAGSSLAEVSQAAALTAALTRRSAAEAAAKAAREAARRRAAASTSAARTTRRQKRQAAAALAAATKTAQQQRKQAAATLAAASKSASKQKRQVTASVAAASAAASSSARDASSALGGKASRSKSRSTRRTKKTVAAVPTRVARRGRKARKSVARKIWDLVVLSAAGGGYVMGAKAGRERYDELGQVAKAVAASPQVQSATQAVKDPQRRADLIVTVQQQAAALFGRRGEHRG